MKITGLVCCLLIGLAWTGLRAAGVGDLWHASESTCPYQGGIAFEQGAVGGKRDVVRVELPRDSYRDKSLRPQFALSGGSLSTHHLSEYDELVIEAYNPGLEPLALAVGFGGRHEHIKQLNLQPLSWCHVAYRLGSMRKVTGERLKSIRIFNADSRRSKAFYVRSIRLAKNRPVTGDEDLLGRHSLWEHVGTVSRQSDGGVKISFKKHVSGCPDWPSVQLWMGAGAGPLDWSAFMRLNVVLWNPGHQLIPLTMLLIDSAGHRRPFDALLGAGQRLALTAPLRSLGNFDLTSVRQVDFFMHRPQESYSFCIERMNLEVLTEADVRRRLEMLDDMKIACGSPANVADRRLVHELTSCHLRLRQALSAFDTPAGLAKCTESYAESERIMEAGARSQSMARLLVSTRKAYSGFPLGLGLADSMTKVMIREMPLEGVTFPETIRVELAKNEVESVQLVVLGDARAERVRVSVGDFQSSTGVVLSARDIEVNLVGQVKTSRPLYPAVYEGWWPDPLLPVSESMVNPGEAVAFWLRVRCSEGQAAGHYRGQVRVETECGMKAEIPMEIRVFDFVLPQQAPMNIATNFQTDQLLAFYPNRNQDVMLDQATQFLGDYGISLDAIYRRSFKGPESLALPVKQLKRLKSQGRLNGFTLCYVGGIGRTVTDVRHPAVRKSIDNALGTLRHWKPVLEREGLWKEARLYAFDEMPPETFPVMQKVLSAIKKEFPDIPILTTAYDAGLGENSPLSGMIDAFVPLSSRYDMVSADRFRAQGGEVWWYVCVIPHAPYGNFLIEYPAIDVRMLMGMLARFSRTDGFLYYSLAMWTGNQAPLALNGPYTSWNPASYKSANGDGYLFYPGPKGLLPSIRAENFRDGLEDLWYFKLLDRYLDTPARRKRYAEVASVSPDLVISPKEYSRSPERIRRKRRRMAEVIEELKREQDKMEPYTAYIPVALGHESEEVLARHLIGLKQEHGMSRFLVTAPGLIVRLGEIQPPSYYREIGKRIAKLKSLTAGHGIEIGYWAAPTFKSGHDASAVPITGIAGQQSVVSYCPLDAEWRRKIIANICAVAAECKPFLVQMEDDYELSNHPGISWGCFCDLHLEAFARKTGKRYTRDELSREFQRPNIQLRRQWGELSKETLVMFARELRAEMDRVSPESRIGMCQPGCSLLDGDFTEAVSRAFAGARHRPQIRLCGSSYSSDDAFNVPARLAKLKYFMENLPGEFELLHETDSYPHTAFFVSSRKLKSLLYTALSYGVHGSLFYALQYVDQPAEEPAYRNLFSRELKRFAMISSLCRRPRRPMTAYRMTCRSDHVYGAEFDGKVLCLGNNPWLDVLARYGLDASYLKADNADATSVIFADVRDLRVMSELEIREMLKHSVVLDGQAADYLTQRGFSSFLGIRARLHVGKVEILHEKIRKSWMRAGNGGREMYNYLIAPAGSEGGFFADLEVLDNQIEVITDFLGKEDGPRLPGMTLFKNELGGKVLVMAYLLDGNRSSSIYNYRKRELLVRLFEDMTGERTVWRPLAPNVFTILNRGREEGVFYATMISMGSDSVEPLTVAAAQIPSSIRELLPDGTWRKVEFAREEATLRLKLTLERLEPVFLEIK